MIIAGPRRALTQPSLDGLGVSSTLITWLRSDMIEIHRPGQNIDVLVWLDQSGNGNHGTKAVEGTPAGLDWPATMFNGFPSVVMQNNADALILTKALGVTFSVFMVWATINDHGNSYPLMGQQNDWQMTSTGNSVLNYKNVGVSTTAGAIYTDVPVIQCAMQDATTMQHWVNGVKRGGTVDPGQWADPGIFSLGVVSAYYTAKARIAELIIYNSILGTTDRQSVERYLGGRYAIATP